MPDASTVAAVDLGSNSFHLIVARLHRRQLRIVDRLHEIGLSLSHHAFHKHGAYILNHADLPGFSRQQQTRLALLVRNHRRVIANRHFNAR